MDASRPITTSTTTITSIRSYSNYDRAQEKLARHKLFLLSCEKLAELRHSNAGNALKKNLAILSVCKKARSSDFYPVNECLPLLSLRESNTRNGPLFTRRSSTTSSPRNLTSTTTTSSSTTIRTIPPMQVTAVIVPQSTTNNSMMLSRRVVEEEEEEDSYPTFSTAPKQPILISSSPTFGTSSSASGAQITKPEKKWSMSEDVVEYSIKDVSHQQSFRSSQTIDFECSMDCDDEIEEGTDALDVFFMDEDGTMDGTSMARKRKSIRWDSVAEKRHCDEEVISPKSTSCPIPIPRPVEIKNQAVLDTLVPMRGFFQFR
jgi:hypothetical protein